MALFKDFSKFGLENLANLTLVDKPSNSSSSNLNELTEADLIYQRKVHCPICNKDFYSSAIKSGKNQLQNIDEDLRTHYSIVDPMLYDVISCPCGHTALNASFATLLPTQRAAVRTKICPNYFPIPIEEVRSINYALDLYQLALAECLIRNGKNIEKAVLCLRISWLYQDLKQFDDETEFIKNAYECFKLSLDTDNYPVLGFDFHKSVYTTSVLSYKISDYSTSLRLLSSLIIDVGVHPKLKDRAMELKTKINKFHK